MSQMDCIIIDDESTARSIMEHLVLQNEKLKLVDQFSDAIQAIKFLNQSSVSLIFLDIHMPSFSGFDFIQTLKNPPKIILTTSDKNFAIEAFEYDCIVDYLVKPISQSRFNKAVEKAHKLNRKPSEKNTSQNDQNQINELYINIDGV